ncbi:NADH-quinone oxidoreductase subunit C [Balneolaceae bacterium ANBcel3]|nr:NADH-quinone oxidoreductase subunit C [Balneolaceae bacterium ANBcel3]
MERISKETLLEKIKNEFDDKVIEVLDDGSYPLVLLKKEAIHSFCLYLKDKLNFIYLNDIFGTDRFTSEERFEVVYHLLSLRHRLRLFVKVRIEENDTELPTVTDIWKSANWNEREVYDMFGITFKGHPDLRRIFMPEDFEYYPLRKEFPLLGIPGSLELPNTTPEHD